jgi:hypothetical protein
VIGLRWLQERMRHGLDSGCVFKVDPTGLYDELSI